MDLGPSSAGDGPSVAEITKLEKEVKQLREERRCMADRVAASMRLASIGQLTAGVAHELNNPLSVILGFAQSASRHRVDSDPLFPSLKAIEREAQRCRRLVQDLLNFSRLPKPGKVMEDVVQVLEGALSLVESHARIQNVKLVRKFEDALPAFFADRHRIQQLLINLCTNAMDAMPKGGTLTVRASRVSDARAPSVIEIAIVDTGVGIATEIRDQIFEPFFTTKPRGKGTGLGLMLVKDIVREHDGRLEIVSHEGRGTTVTVRLVADQRAIPARLGKSSRGEKPSL